ncbi:hypothetical protein GPECTOR_62g937 [Gonium pectorale]|uniref:Uncharacterized protein n=1 Tax=Gonium pectorale TaxID=33097 RepID=A0A150G4N3_GONPE|nr:hypothetical protein GPECTOR_62g937 [Gonium pectorale]|eukprot:KXZ44822.1 hypothetical protein GPECTOR_62g937 [Gonium pectorale]
MGSPASSLPDLVALAALGNAHVAGSYDMARLTAATAAVAAARRRAAEAALAAVADDGEPAVADFAPPHVRGGPGRAQQRTPLIPGHA